MSSQPEWLIRSGSRILGPYTQAEVLLKLREKELSLHDEVSDPVGRWWPIQFHPRMEDIVEDFRSQTATDRTDLLGTATPTVSVTDALNEGSAKAKPESKVAETFGVYRHSQQNQNSKKLYKTLWLGSLVIIAGGILFFWTQKQNKVQQTSQNEQASDLKNAERALFVGDYRQALESYKRVAAKNPQDHSYSMYLAPLYLQDGNQILLAKREFENIPKLNQSAEMQTALGLMYFLENNKEKAGQTWAGAIQLNSSFEPAFLNTAYLYMHAKAWGRSREWIEASYMRGQSSADWNIAYAVSSIEAYEKNKIPRLLTEAQLMLSNLHLRNQDRMQDILLIRMRIESLSNNDENFRKLTADFLNQEIDGFKKVRHNAFVASRWFEDEFMIPLCKKNAASISGTIEKGLFEVYCFIRSNKMDLAQKKITQLREQMPKNVLVLAWASYLLNQLQQQDEASVLLGRALEGARSSEYVLPSILQAQFCQVRKDYACAEQSWKNVIKSLPDSLPALTGLAIVKSSTGRHSEAAADLQRIQSISEDYKPFLELQWKEKEGTL